jgi:hypothetical protein
MEVGRTHMRKNWRSKPSLNRNLKDMCNQITIHNHMQSWQVCQSEQVIASFLSQITLLNPHSSCSGQSLIAMRHSLPSMQGCGQSKSDLKTSTKRAPKTSSTKSETKMHAYWGPTLRNLNSSYKRAATHYYIFSGLKRFQILDNTWFQNPYIDTNVDPKLWICTKNLPMCSRRHQDLQAPQRRPAGMPDWK